MNVKLDIIDRIRSKHYFGSLPAFQTDTWAAWITWLKSVFALPMSAEELKIYRECTARTSTPRVPPTEIYTVVGRRGGKSFISALTAVYSACFQSYARYLTAGEHAVVLVLARDRDQARIVFSYVSGILHAVPVLNKMIDVERADEIELSNNVIIAIKTSDYRAIRGSTVALAICDEISFWDTEGSSPDHEVLTALRPAMSTIPGAKLIAISTPYSESGSIWEMYREHFGHDDDAVLIWQAPSVRMNPTLDVRLIERELERDPDSAQAEWLATFRTDLQAAFSPEKLEECTIKGRLELPPSPIIPYVGFTDPSGGRNDSFTLCIAHKERGIAVLDRLEAWRSPFDPGVVVKEAAEILKRYGLTTVTGDRFAAEWPIACFRAHGVLYEQCEKPKSDLYLTLIPVVNSKQVELLDHRQLTAELRRLERRRGRQGRDSIDHPPRLHDDLANSVAGACYLLLGAEGRPAQSGFNVAKHIAHNELTVACLEPIYIGLAFDPPASVIAQHISGSIPNELTAIQILAAIVSDTSLADHLTRVRQWLMTHAPGQKIRSAYSDSLDVQSGWAMVEIIESVLPGDWERAYKPIEGRRETLLRVLGEADRFSFEPRLKVSPSATLIAPALSRRWEPDEKSVYASVQNATSLVIERIESMRITPHRITVEATFDARNPPSIYTVEVDGDFSKYR